MSARGNSRGSLPTISNHQLTYSQRYEHMTKLANYGELNETQIWKEYEKLRACLKELNEEVLRHMEKKAYGSVAKNEKAREGKDQEGTLVVLEDEKRANDTRLHTYANEMARHDERIKHLAAKPNLLDELTTESAQLGQRMKQATKDNKNLKRNAELQGRDLVNNTSILDRIMLEETKLTRVFNLHKKYDEHLKTLNQKNDRFREKIVELKRAIDLRVEQFSRGENYIAEEIHFERYQQLKRQREAVSKYEPVYKRNYLMKLKELETLVNNIARQDRILQETETSVVSVRSEIEVITQLVGGQQYRKRNHSSLLAKKPDKMSATLTERQERQERREEESALEEDSLLQEGRPNDKNKQ